MSEVNGDGAKVPYRSRTVALIILWHLRPRQLRQRSDSRRRETFLVRTTLVPATILCTYLCNILPPTRGIAIVADDS
ncbi:hypothetical protein BST61_g10749 [Cercospora zeina]